MQNPAQYAARRGASSVFCLHKQAILTCISSASRGCRNACPMGFGWEEGRERRERTRWGNEVRERGCPVVPPLPPVAPIHRGARVSSACSRRAATSGRPCPGEATGNAPSGNAHGAASEGRTGRWPRRTCFEVRGSCPRSTPFYPHTHELDEQGWASGSTAGLLLVMEACRTKACHIGA
eukprot:365480-Chlamydomonas_euryale.AAC.19